MMKRAKSGLLCGLLVVAALRGTGGAICPAVVGLSEAQDDFVLVGMRRFSQIKVQLDHDLVR